MRSAAGARAGCPVGPEEDMYWQRSRHKAGEPIKPFGPKTHSSDDNFPPDHWVAFLGGSDLQNATDETKVSLRAWCWGGRTGSPTPCWPREINAGGLALSISTINSNPLERQAVATFSREK